MNRDAPIAYDYQTKGAADFKAGRKDERLYANAENHGASYRRGWQQARREAEASQETRPAPDPVKVTETPPPVCCSLEYGGGDAPEVRHRPEEWNGVHGSVSIVQPEQHVPTLPTKPLTPPASVPVSTPKADDGQLSFF